MAVSGKVYLIPQPENRTWRMVVHNTGSAPMGVTQNILPKGRPDLKVHDDHVKYGHGMLVNPGTIGYIDFQEGDTYTHQGSGSSVTIADGCHLRVGIRGHAFGVFDLPPLDPGVHPVPVELDIRDFTWYSGSPDTTTAPVNNWPGSRAPTTNVVPDLVLSQIEAMILAANNGIRCEGTARIKAIKGEDGLSHWEVWFENSGEQAWIGTVVFKDAEKNDGVGLESMALPGQGTAAMQRIEYRGNYGIEADPGRTVRLGVRGYAWTEVPLPAEGEVEIPIQKFKLDTRNMSDEYFDRDQILKKRAEKVNRVQFFENGEPINDSLEPPVFRGAEAAARSLWDPPKLRVEPVEPGAELPQGGWRVTMENTLPEFDDYGRMGFVAAMRVRGADITQESAQRFPVRRFTYPGQSKTWLIERGSDVGGVRAEVGAPLQVATRGLGWLLELPLPEPGQTVDAEKGELWVLREDQCARRLLRPEFIHRFRDDS